MEDNNIQFVVDENGYKHYLEKEIIVEARVLPGRQRILILLLK